MSAGEIVAVVAAGVAVATSIGSLVVSIAALRRDRPHLRVETSFAIVARPGEDLKDFIQINVINDGRQTEIVSSLGFRSDQKQLLMVSPENFPNGQLPWRLEANESNMAIIPEDVLRRQCQQEDLKISHVFARTQSGRLYRNKAPKGLIDFLARQNG